MARKLRVEYEGAVYHVINRGDRREPIFKDDEDRLGFVATLGEACAKTGWQVHALNGSVLDFEHCPICCRHHAAARCGGVSIIKN